CISSIASLRSSARSHRRSSAPRSPTAWPGICRRSMPATIWRSPTRPAATRPGTPTPKAMVADNDLGLGRIVDVGTHSPVWKDTAIFVIEDDAQNGPDHVDAHRTVCLVASPYAKRGWVDHTTYSTVSMLRTIELHLGACPDESIRRRCAPHDRRLQRRIHS